MKHIACTEKSWAICVPSRGRADFFRDCTGVVPYLPWKDKDQDIKNPGPYVFVRGSELENYRYFVNEDFLVAVPDHFNIAQKRQFMLEWASSCNLEYIFQIDDDVRLDYRRTDDRTKFLTCAWNAEKLWDLFETCLRICGEKFPMVHPRTRMFANEAKFRYEKNTSAIRCVCLHVPTVYAHGSYTGLYEKYGAIYMSDRYMQHTLMSKGFVTIALGQFCSGDNGTNVKGGCSLDRTVELQSASAIALAKEFPNVSLRSKNNGNWSEHRYDVTQRFKAYLPKGTKNYVPKEEMEKDWDDV